MAALPLFLASFIVPWVPEPHKSERGSRGEECRSGGASISGEGKFNFQFPQLNSPLLLRLDFNLLYLNFVYLVPWLA